MMHKDSRKDRGIWKEEPAGQESARDLGQEHDESGAPHDEAYYDALIKKRIGEALRTEARAEKLDVEVLRAWVAADRQKRIARRRRYAAICASIVLVCSAAFGMKTLTDSNDYYAIAGKNKPITSEQDGNTVIKNNDEGLDESIGEQEVVVENWEHVADVKKIYPELLTPEYIPEGYNFKELRIKVTEFSKNYTYTFSNKTEDLYLTQTTETDTNTIKNYAYTLETNSGLTIMIKEDIQKMGGCIFDEEMFVFVKGNIDDQEFIDIVEGLKR